VYLFVLKTASSERSHSIGPQRLNVIRLVVTLSLLAIGSLFASPRKRTPLELALRSHDHVALAKILANQKGGAFLLPGGTPAILVAARVNDLEAIKLLVLHHANVNVVDKRGQAALSDASWHGDLATVRFLLAHGANPRRVDRLGETALSMAHDGVIATALIKAGANLETRDGDGTTPLGAACTTANPDVAWVLIRAGANTRVKNREGDNLIADTVYAAQFTRDEIPIYAEVIKLLRKAGVDPSERNRYGKSSFDWARKLDLGDPESALQD
jgi:ankyrin repeat protein